MFKKSQLRAPGARVEAIGLARTARRQARAAGMPWLIALALGGLALLPRALGLADFMTTDETYHWIARVDRFSAALAERRWADMVLTGHPGITLLWVSQLGLALERAFGAAPAPSAIAHLAWLRLPTAVLESLCVPIGYLLLRRLVAPATALLAACMWATSPYLIAHARLLHLDALLTTFVTLTVLCVLIGCRAAHPWRWVAAAGGCAGLALLTKGPSLILLPTVGLLLLWQAAAPDLPARLWRVAGLYSLWLGVAALVFTLLWPTMWVDPRHALRAFADVIVSNGGRPNGAGQFFLGRAVADPGPLFYLVADLFRMTPTLLLGLLGLPPALRWVDQASRTPRRCGLWSFVVGRWSAEQRALLALGAFVCVWTLVMTLGPKKFDRYTLPTWPALLVLAAAGWRFWLWDALPRLARRGVRAGRGVLLAALVGLECVQLGWYHPYYLSYYNPLLGGGAAAQRALLIGWGEAMDQVGAYLRARPDIGYGPVLSALPPTLRPFVPVPVKDVLEIGDGPANYAVVYLESVQLNNNPAIYAAIRRTTPLHRVTIHGIDYAEIYQLPRPFAHTVDARFGDALELRGVTLAHAPGRLIVTPAWDVREQPTADYVVFVHVVDLAGRMVAQVDVPPGGPAGVPTSAWEAGRQVAVPLPVPLPQALPRGDYQVMLGLYDTQTGARLPVLGGIAADSARGGAQALLLDTVTLP